MTKGMQFHKGPIKLISSLSKPNWGQLQKSTSPLHGLKTKLQPVRKNFDLFFHSSTFPSNKKGVNVGKYFKNITYSNSKWELVLNDLYLREMASPWVKGEVSFFHTKGFSKKQKYYYRLVIPLDKKLDFHYELEEYHFTTDLGYNTRTGTAATINDDFLTVNVIRDREEGGNYLIIQSKILQDYDTFGDKTFAIINGLGYLTGYLAGNNGFYFAYTQKEMQHFQHFYFSEMRSAINSGYSPIYTNPYGYLSKQRKTADRYYKNNTLRTVSIKEFSTFCQLLHDSIEFRSVILLILESSVASLLFMPGGFAIALETLSDIIIGKDKINLAPIKEAAKAKSLRKECTDIINKHSEGIDRNDLKTLLGRIENINQPTNKARLRAPFAKLGIELLPEDLEILNSRNDFLHGRIPDISRAGAAISDERRSRDLYYASMRFYTLLNILILKHIGFNNYVLNYPKLKQEYCQIKLKEKPYRKI